MIWLRFSCVLAALALFNVAHAEEPTPRTIAERITGALGEGDRESAVKAAESLLEASQQPAAVHMAADAMLRAGKLERALRLYDKYVAMRPARKPFLWQRGIALALTGRFREGAEQFELHRTVNPYDVENAAWHFLCVAKDQSLAEAKRQLLPAPRDARPPMKEILDYLRRGNAAPVTRRIQSFAEGSSARRRAEFYGNLYLGLVADAKGNQASAANFMRASVANAENDYMGDVARVYASLLEHAAASSNDRSAVTDQKQPHVGDKQK